MLSKKLISTTGLNIKYLLHYVCGDYRLYLLVHTLSLMFKKSMKFIERRKQDIIFELKLTVMAIQN